MLQIGTTKLTPQALPSPWCGSSLQREQPSLRNETYKAVCSHPSWSSVSATFKINRINMLSAEIIQQAHRRIQPYIHHTPLLSSATIAQQAGCTSLHFKCQNMQKIGAFKARGAFNKLLQLDPSVKAVCTHSSGNHAQAVAYAAKKLGLRSFIIMPANSPAIKHKAVREYNGVVFISENSIKAREELAAKISAEEQACFVHPYDDYDIIAGQATSALEVFKEKDDLDYLVVPVGGGGLASGSVLSAKYFGGKCKVVAAEPYLARDAKMSLEKGSIEPQLPPMTIADGLRANLGSKTFQILRHHLHPEDVILVTEEQIILATQLVMERMKLVIQPSSATVVAAVLKDQRFRGKKVCCILSGGNLELAPLFDSLRPKL